MPDADNNFGGALGLDFRKWWRHVQPKNCVLDSILAFLLEAGKASARKLIHNWSCGQNNFASEDQRSWTEGRKIIAFGFFLFHCWPILPVQFLYLRLELQKGIAPRAKRFGNGTYFTASQLMNENCSILKRKQISLLFQWWIFNDE